MTTVKITDAKLRKMEAGDTLRDGATIGFQARKQKKKIVFRIEYKSPTKGTRRYYTIGPYGQLTLPQAEQIAKCKLGMVAQGKDPQDEKVAVRDRAKNMSQRTLRNWLEGDYKKWVTDKRKHTVKNTIELHFDDLLDTPMDEVKKDEVEKWLIAYKGQPDGANRIVNDLRGVITKAVKQGVIEHHPLANLAMLKVDKNQRRKPLTKAEEKRLRETLDRREARRREERLRCIERQKERGINPVEPYGTFTDYIKPLVLLALDTGLRKGEIFNLFVEDVDLEAPIPYITIVGLDKTGRRNKTGTTRFVPLTKTLTNALSAWIKEKPTSDYLFPSSLT